MTKTKPVVVSETVQERNMRMGWGCVCHGETFCPDLRFSHYENDVPVFVKKDRERTDGTV